MKNKYAYILTTNYNCYDTNYHFIDLSNDIDYLIDTSDAWEELDYRNITDITELETDDLLDLVWKIKPHNGYTYGKILQEY